jgi:hypothetical protein
MMVSPLEMPLLAALPLASCSGNGARVLRPPLPRPCRQAAQALLHACALLLGSRVAAKTRAPSSRVGSAAQTRVHAHTPSISWQSRASGSTLCSAP